MRHEQSGRAFPGAVSFRGPRSTTAKQTARLNFILVALLSQLLLLASLPETVYSTERKALTPVGEIVLITGKVLVKLTPEEVFKNAQAR